MADRDKSPMLGMYPMHEVLSSLRKTIKLNDLDQAIYWSNVILTYGGNGGKRMLLKQLWIMAAEDIDDFRITLQIAAVWSMVDLVPETDHLFFLVAKMCRARKWWETEEGRAVDEAWARAIGDLKTNPREIPGYALDRHTRRGWDLKRQGIPFDDRFSGTEIGRMKTVYLFLQHGALSADLMLDDGFWEFWNERKRLMAMHIEDPKPGVSSQSSSDDGENGQASLL